MEIASCYLDGNADAVEFCPHEPFHHILAAATYTLQEQQVDGHGDSHSHRDGSISLFSVSNTGVADTDLQLLHRQSTAGIFDMKWNPVRETTSNSPLLALADADGFLTVRKLESETSTPNKVNLKEICGEKISECMCLYVDWNPSLDSLSVSHSDGSISLISFSESELKVSQSWQAHDFEAWVTSFDIFNSHLLYTGSDDCRFSCWDTRQNPSTPVFNNSKSHRMGVCCISQSSFNSNVLYTGSYDESIRVWDMRFASKPVNEKRFGLGGGVWRIKAHPSVSDIVLAACMHNGFAILGIGQGEKELVVLERYEKHVSLAYGADWKKGDDKDGGSIVATCSFYDRLVRVWQPECFKNSMR